MDRLLECDDDKTSLCRFDVMVRYSFVDEKAMVARSMFDCRGTYIESLSS